MVLVFELIFRILTELWYSHYTIDEKVKLSWLALLYPNNGLPRSRK